MRNDQLIEWFQERLAALAVEEETRAYIVGLFSEMRRTDDHDREMSDESMVLAFATAVRVGSFQGFQRVGDWGLWVSVYAPESVESPDVVHEISMLSYDACDRIMLRRWPSFNELARRLPEIVESARRLVR